MADVPSLADSSCALAAGLLSSNTSLGKGTDLPEELRFLVSTAGVDSGSEGRGLIGAGRGNASIVHMGRDEGRRQPFFCGNFSLTGLAMGSLPDFPASKEADRMVSDTF